MRIVRADNAGPVRPGAMLLRYVPLQLMATIPLVKLLALVDVLFIFSGERRCVHDLIAGTRVVRA